MQTRDHPPGAVYGLWALLSFPQNMTFAGAGFAREPVYAGPFAGKARSYKIYPAIRDVQ
jgi:hypothetical protein